VPIASKDGLINITVITPKQLHLLLLQQRIEYVESVYLADKFIWIKKMNFSFTLDPEMFGHSVAYEVSTYHRAMKAKVLGKHLF
jgi:hypothetical protein